LKRHLMPEDAVIETKGIVEGQQFARVFCIDNAEAFVSLIATYQDDAAHEQLDGLREAFWAVMKRDPKECEMVKELRERLERKKS
jgi:hypothetical protein